MKTIIIILFFTIPFFAQELTNKFVEEIIYSGDEIFLMVDDGFLKINQTDSYEEYYRKIYNDSTITNPNTILNSNVDLNIIPFINLSSKTKKHRFKNPLELGVFLSPNAPNGYIITPYAQGLIDSIKTK